MSGKKKEPVNDNTFYFPGQKGSATGTGDPLSDGEEEGDDYCIEFKVIIISRLIPRNERSNQTFFSCLFTVLFPSRLIRSRPLAEEEVLAHPSQKF